MSNKVMRFFALAMASLFIIHFLFIGRKSFKKRYMNGKNMNNNNNNNNNNYYYGNDDDDAINDDNDWDDDENNNNSNNYNNNNYVIIIKEFIEVNHLQCRSFTKPTKESIVMENVNWQIQQFEMEKLFLYSAFYDDRPHGGNLPYVRVIGILTFQQDTRYNCHLWYSHVRKPFIIPAVINETGINRYQFEKVSYREYTFSCQLPFVIPYVPNYVSVMFADADCTNYTNYIPIFYRERNLNPDIEFGLCVCNGHGFFQPEYVVEWIEFYKLMGVREFNLYNTTYEELDQILNYYVERGELRVSQLRHPLGRERGDRGRIRNLRITALNDCMMRNMYRYKYLVVLDLDEMIFPRRNLTNYHQLIEEARKLFNKNYEILSFSFHQAYFFLTFEQDLYQPWYMKSLRFRYRSKPNDDYVGSKSILRPIHCFNLMNHYCYVSLPLYNGIVSHFVSEDLGISHHYRHCGKFTGTKTCEGLFREKTADDTAMKFGGPLTKNVQRHLKQLGLLKM